MKKSIPVIVALLLMLVICVISCADANTPDDTTDAVGGSSETPRQTIGTADVPSEPPRYVPVAEADLFPVPFVTYSENELEQDYDKDNFEVTLEKDTYPINFTGVVINVKNLNGKCFEMFIHPYLEKWNEETESWDLIEHGSAFFSPVYYNWKQYKPEATIAFARKHIAQEYKELITPGTYRLQVFVGPEAIYTPTFTVTTEYELDK